MRYIMKTSLVDDNPPAAPATSPPRRTLVARFKEAFPRLLYAHLVAYPLTFAWAVAAIPPCLYVIPDKIIFKEDVTVVSQMVLANLRWPALFVAIVSHAIALPWGFVREENRKRARRLYWISVGVLFAIAVVVGGGWWIWLMTRSR
jgi:hypothetical protein